MATKADSRQEIHPLLARIIAAAEAYRDGEITIETAQSSIELNSDALKGDVPEAVRTATHHAAAELEMLRFTEHDTSARAPALAALDEMERAVRAHYPAL